MYGGLFGDLPATKHQILDAAVATPVATSTDATTSTTESQLQQQSQTVNLNTNSKNSTTTSTSTITSSTSTIPSTMMIVPHRIRPTIQLQQPLLAHTMRPRQSQSQIRKRPISTVPQLSKTVVLVQDKDNIETEDRTISDPPKSATSLEQTSTDTSTSRIDVVKVGEEAESDKVGTDTSMTTMQQLDLEERLRILNANAIEQNDIYNPLLPNDVLVYWEQQARRKEQEQYEIERQSILQEQEILRQVLEQERNELLQQAIRAEQQQQVAVITQNLPDATITTPIHTTTTTNEYYQKIIQQEQHRTMGRGRGNIASNLPAWLVQKQQQQQQQILSKEKET